MCTGIETAALLATLAGTGAQYAASEQEKSAMNSKLRAEMQRQSDFAKKGKAVYQASLGESTPEKARAQISEGASKANQEYEKVQQQALPSAPLALGSDKDQIIQGERNKGYVGQLNQNAAGLQGYDTFSLLQAIKNLRAGTQLGQISQNAQRSQQVLPYELQDASRSASGLSSIGTILSTVGGLAGMYGAMSSAGMAASNAASSGAAQNALAAQLAPNGLSTVGGTAGATIGTGSTLGTLNPALLRFGAFPALGRTGYQLGQSYPSMFSSYGGTL